MSEAEPTHDPAADKFSAEDVAAARLLLMRNPVASAHALRHADEMQFSLVWMSWLDRADALSRFAGNTLGRELLLRAALGTAAGVGVGWLVVGFALAWSGLGLTAIVCTWWWFRRRAWRSSVALHIVWGALLSGEVKRRFGVDPPELEKALADKVLANVSRFTANYETWVRHPIARRVG